MWKLSEGATAIVGTVIGTLLGGLTSFAATYEQNRSQDREAALLREQEAYVLVLSAANECRLGLVEMVGVSDTDDEEVYEKVRKTTDASATKLSTAITRAGLVLKDPQPVYDLSNAFLEVGVAYDAADPQTGADLDKIIKKGDAASTTLEEAARKVVQERIGD